MSAQPQPLRSAMLPILAAGLLMLSNCSFSFKVDPATTVMVEITGVNDEEDRDDIRETLIGMTDG